MVGASVSCFMAIAKASQFRFISEDFLANIDTVQLKCHGTSQELNTQTVFFSSP